MCDREKERERERKNNTRFGPWVLFPIRRMKMDTEYVNRIIFDRIVLFS